MTTSADNAEAPAAGPLDLDRAARPRSGLLRGMVTAGLIGFGGGSALIPVVEKEIVDKRPLLERPVFIRHTVVANVTPGALPVKLAAAAGSWLSGGGLGLAAAVAVAAPGTLGTLGLVAAAEALGPGAIRLVSYASVGITAFIIVLLIGYIWKVHAHAPRLPLFLAITLVSALLNGAGPIVRVAATLAGSPTDLSLPHLSAVEVILLALAVIVVLSLVTARGRSTTAEPSASAHRGGTRRIWRAASWFGAAAGVGVAAFGGMGGLAGLKVAGLLALSTVTSFGGGEAYIGVADGFFVRTGLIGTEEFFTQLVPIANALPGPILIKVAAGVGYSFGAASGPLVSWTLGIAAALITIGATCAVALPVLGAYDTLQRHPVVINVGTYILPVICGLLIQVSASMLEVSATVAGTAGIAATPLTWVTLVLIGAMSYAHLRHRIPDTLMLIACGAASLLVLSR